MSDGPSIRSIQYGSRTHVVDSGLLPDATFAEINYDLKVLKSKQQEWAQKLPLSDRIDLLRRTLLNIEFYGDEWAHLDMEARHIPEGHWGEADSYALGPGGGGRLVRAYLESLETLQTEGAPKVYAKAFQDGDRVTVQTFPHTLKDNLFLPGIKTEVHLAKGTKLEDLWNYQAKVYKDPNYEGGISLVLCAGNVAYLSLNDMLHKLIVEKKVVILKTHPVLEYLGDLYTKILEPFISAGYLRVVRGGAKVGDYLTHHPMVDDIHMTGSDKTFEAIVYGTGEEGQKNKLMDNRIMEKPVSAELGNVSPVIVMPGDWTDSDYDYHASEVLTALGLVNGYSCSAARVLVLPKNWPGSEKLISKISEKMSESLAPVNYYPGTHTIVEEAMVCYPDMEKHGKLDKDHQPWMFVKGLDPDKPEFAFRREFWSTFISQVFINAKTPEEYLEKAVKFSNEKLWGTLAASLIIDPKTEREMRKTGTFQKAIDDLHYGTVSINVYPGLAILLGTTPWGGYPGSTYTNIQSGNCFVSNANMFENVEKSVVTAPFRMSPKPLWFIGQKTNVEAAKAFSHFATTNKMMDFGRLVKAMMLG
jgi:hypothetical protein